MQTHKATLLALIGSVQSLDNGLGLVPQMGWNTWNKFACGISEDLIKATADQLVDMGLDKLGYKYINLDDCWMQEERSQDGHIQISENFPSGMKSLGDYLHSKDLKFGVYSSAGTMTCEKKAGSLGFETLDADDYASWGVDYLKYDNCFNQKVPAMERYPVMRDALNATGREIFYSICNWGEEDTVNWGPEVGNSWRTTQDIFDGWSSIEFNFHWNMKRRDVSGSGSWNDPDMLEVGNGGMTIEEERTHFALWAMSKAPLIIGCDLSTIRQASLDILMNEEIIAINQDPESKQATCVLGCSWFDRLMRKPSVWTTTLSGGETVAAIVNWREIKWSNYQFELKDIGIVPKDGDLIQIRDLNKQIDLGTFADKKDEATVLIDELPGHGSRVYKFKIIPS